MLRQYLSSMQQRSWRLFIDGEIKNHFSITDLLSTVYDEIFGSRFQIFPSDCNTRQTSIKQAERNKSMTGCICRLGRRDISGSRTMTLLAALSSVAQFPKVHVNNRPLTSGFSAISKSLLGPHVLTGPAETIWPQMDSVRSKKKKLLQR